MWLSMIWLQSDQKIHILKSEVKGVSLSHTQNNPRTSNNTVDLSLNVIILRIRGPQDFLGYKPLKSPSTSLSMSGRELWKWQEDGIDSSSKVLTLVIILTLDGIG